VQVAAYDRAPNAENRETNNNTNFIKKSPSPKTSVVDFYYRRRRRPQDVYFLTHADFGTRLQAPMKTKLSLAL
jgi:hypothetical protein